MKQEQSDSKACDVIERASQYVRSELGLSDAVIKKHKTNWLHFLEFTANKRLEHDLENAFTQFIGCLSRDNPKLPNPDDAVLYSVKLLKEYLRSGKILHTRETLMFHGEIGLKMKEYVSEKVSEHLRPSSIHSYRHQLSRFSNYLSKSAIDHVVDIRVEHILLYIMELPSEHKSNTYIAISIVKRFLKWLYDRKTLALNLSIQIPSGRYVQQSSLPAIYTQAEVELTLKNGVDRGYPTGKRDFLILLLAARLGLRASDICNLKFENIQWDKNSIVIEQVKTERILELPLLAEVGNAIIDYLQYGRPKSEEAYIVLTATSPIRKMIPSSISGITTAAFKRAGVNIANKKHGPHALRHSLVARMLEGQTILPVISEVLGHENTNSTMYYMRIDLSSLNACVLDVVSVKGGFYGQFKW